MSNRNMRQHPRPMQVGPSINQSTDEVEDYEFADDYENVKPVQELQTYQGKKVVDDSFERDLPQYRGIDKNIDPDLDEFGMFDVMADRLNKVASYDGIPTKPLKDMCGNTYRITGAIVAGKHTFRPKDYDGTVEGYDKLKIKVTHQRNGKGEFVPVGDGDRKFIILATSATQPFDLFSNAHKLIKPGDFPKGKYLEYTVTQTGNEIFIGPIE